jgi:hypothetical protein
MWVFTKDGFFAAVFKDCEKDEVMIKAKSNTDLQALLKKIGNDNAIHETSESDYPFFVVLKKTLWIQYLDDYVQRLDYETVRNNIVSSTDAARHKAYQTVWAAMYNWMGCKSLHKDDI